MNLDFIRNLLGTLFSDYSGVLVGFALGYFGTRWHDNRRDRVRRGRFATALVFEIRLGLENLDQLQRSLEESGSIVYTNDFSDLLFQQAQADIAQLSGQAYFPISSYFAQLRNINFLRGETGRLRDELLAAESRLGIDKTGEAHHRHGVLEAQHSDLHR